ncbi:molybdotransferase-like divisome protein Glp [Longivirga aurantiaca]|uniref:Molybdopterin molybdenumtransferase n=1 Tax=Longivirga aurantiaca TaxID=1837743 RepID=A0ABW1SXC1_9ACTN
MRSVEEHLQRVLAGVVPLSPLDHTLLDARGCVLAEDVTAPWPLPPFDNSAMDGYAVRVEDVKAASDGKPVVLRVVDDVPAGYRASVPVTEGTAIRIMTGAPMPEGAEAVVPVEWTDGGMPEVTIMRDVAHGAHVRSRGDDVSLGDVVATSGTVLGPREIALLAAVGRGRVSVHPAPRVVILSTGSELVEPGTPLQPGLITDSNGYTIAAAVQEAGAIAYRVGPVPDDAPLLLSTIEDQLVRADMIVTTGGVSAGAYDTVKAVLSRLGTVEFTKVAMQPGMPQGHGFLGPEQTPIFTLPGNPVSAYVSFEVFVRPVLRRMLGHQRIYRPVVRAVLTETLMSPQGKRQFARGHLSVEEGRYVVRPAGGQGSHMLGAMAQANCLVVVPEDVTEVKPGTALAVLRLDEA